MSEKILIIDDEQDIADLLEVYLKNENYVVHKFYCATDAMSCIESGDIDLAILDIMLPDMNGFSLCQLIRKKYTYPIIMLTAKIEETDKITGLTLGADDYVTKPFRPLEVVARVKAQLRRYKKYSPGIITEKVPSELSYNKLCLNVQTHECLLDGETVSLTPTEFSILQVLLESAGNVVSIEELFHAVWKDEYYSKNSSTITVHIRHLREKLKDTSDTPQYIIKPLGHMNIADVTADDIRLALVPVSKKSASVYKSVNILYKSIFAAAKESKVIQDNPTIYLSGKNGGVPQKEKTPLTDDQVERLLDAIKGLPPYVFVMLGLYAGLRREEILALQWDSVFLDEAAPYLTVCRAWHTEHNRPVIMSELKTKAAHRDIPLPDCLTKCLREAKETSTSDYVVANSEGEPLSYTQFKRLWQYIVTRTVKERS